jgi:hypothetical protein
MARCRSLWWLPPLATVLPRLRDYAVQLGGLQLLCAAPPSRMADRFCSSKVRCARPPVCPCKLARDSHRVYYGAASTP